MMIFIKNGKVLAVSISDEFFVQSNSFSKCVSLSRGNKPKILHSKFEDRNLRILETDREGTKHVTVQNNDH